MKSELIFLFQNNLNVLITSGRSLDLVSTNHIFLIYKYFKTLLNRLGFGVIGIFSNNWDSQGTLLHLKFR